MAMPDWYFETQFHLEAPFTDWPEEFVILSAYTTTGEHWSDEVILAADQRLQRELQERGEWFLRVTGYSPHDGHAEPGWALALPFDEACDWGLRYKQDAIYCIKDDELWVTYCDARRTLVRVGEFRSRLSPKQSHHISGKFLP